MNIVIGSGPSGIAAAHALLEQGEPVLLLDGGLSLEADQEKLLAQVREGGPGAAELLQDPRLQTPVSKKGVELKLAYGSDFAYRDTLEHLGFSGLGTGLLPSLARGGLSNVWGAAVLPYLQKDMTGWPITVGELAPHYEAALKITGLAAREDDLAENFPLYTKQFNRLEPSAQAERLLAKLDGMKTSLRRDGITHGTSRLAVGPNQSHSQNCIYCGQCMHGCAYGAIYCSAQDVDKLGAKTDVTFAYQPDIIVEKIAERNGTVTVSGRHRQSAQAVELEGTRAFLAAGVIPSTRIVLRSLEAYDHPLTFHDSQYFIMPVLSLRGHGDAADEELHTLSQLFLEIADEKVSPYTVHLQLYTYNDLIPRVLREKLWFAPGLRELIVRPLEHRLLVLQGYLHSAHSGKLSARLTRNPADGKERFVVEGQPSAEAKVVIARVARKLSGHLSKLGLFPLLSAVDVTLPGRGFHSGGSFPMKRQPGAFESDLHGCVPGLEGVHLVDASVFPSVPATTITLTAMANAHRVASTWRQRGA